jgi:hypothetical protein
MPLGEILLKVGAKSGVKFTIEADLNRPVTTELTSVPLDKGIHSLVQPNSLAMIYSKKEDGTVVLTSVRIFDKQGPNSLSSEPLRRFNTLRGFPVYRDADRAARPRPGVNPAAGNGQRSRSHRDAEIVLPDSDSQADSEAGPDENTSELFSTDVLRQGR